MRALICGITGQDGSYLAKLLVEKGYEVIGSSRDALAASLDNLQRLGIQERVMVTSMAINDFRSVLSVINKYAPDEIYNLAGQTSVGLSFEQPVEAMESISLGTLNILEAIRFVGQPIRFYNAGSSECFGDTGSATADESTPFCPRSPYAVAKSSSHWLVQNYRDAYGLFGCTGILFNHESPLRPQRFVTQKIVRAAFPVHYTGHLHDDLSLRALYSAADAFVLPSRQDNLPNTGLEAHACGTPVVAFNTGGLPDIVADRVTGALAEPFEPASLAAAIRWVLEDPPRRGWRGCMRRCTGGRPPTPWCIRIVWAGIDVTAAPQWVATPVPCLLLRALQHPSAMESCCCRRCCEPSTLQDPIVYGSTQQLGDWMREQRIGAFEYLGARSSDLLVQVGVFTPALFQSTPFDQVEITREFTAVHALFLCRDHGRLHHFPRELFLIEGQLPRASS
jgi:nucleoside-diphosphate-sugar epimerase